MRKMSLCFQDKIENTKCINSNTIIQPHNGSY